MSVGPAKFERKVPTLDVTQITKASAEGVDTRIARRMRTGGQEADTPDSAWLLPRDGDRDSDEQKEDGNQLGQGAPPLREMIRFRAALGPHRP
jgi:hypothetical protein